LARQSRRLVSPPVSEHALVDWDGDGQWELVVGADMGFIWYFKPEHFGRASGRFDVFRPPGDTSL